MTIGDKCPYCGRELFSGYLQSARQIIWSQEEKSISCLLYTSPSPRDA